MLYYAPGNGIGVKRSSDLKTWTNEGLLTLGQKNWPWSKGRLTAGFVLDLRSDPKVGKAMMFFHRSDFKETDPRGGFDNYASLGMGLEHGSKELELGGKDSLTFRAAFNAKFFNVSAHAYATGSQVANAVPLALGMGKLGVRRCQP